MCTPVCQCISRTTTHARACMKRSEWPTSCLPSPGGEQVLVWTGGRLDFFNYTFMTSRRASRCDGITWHIACWTITARISIKVWKKVETSSLFFFSSPFCFFYILPPFFSFSFFHFSTIALLYLPSLVVLFLMSPRSLYIQYLTILKHFRSSDRSIKLICFSLIPLGSSELLTSSWSSLLWCDKRIKCSPLSLR